MHTVRYWDIKETPEIYSKNILDNVLPSFIADWFEQLGKKMSHVIGYYAKGEMQA